MKISKAISSGVAIVLFLASAYSQSTTFVYQGHLKTGDTSATGNYDFQFALFDAESGGTQIGVVEVRNSVAVTDGHFTVLLDFGGVFTGDSRYLEIRVRQTGVGVFSTLSPRAAIASAPYAVRSMSADTATTATSATNALNATNAQNATNALTATNALALGGVLANQFVQTSDPRLSDGRSPLPGSASYIQNQNAGYQSSSNFKITGTGTASILAAETQFNSLGGRILASPGFKNLFAGYGAGLFNAGTNNAFFGDHAGRNNTNASFNTFIGDDAGYVNSTGEHNTFLGARAGRSNNTGANNTFVGLEAGRDNSSSGGNSFFGYNAGRSSLNGLNTFIGASSGLLSINGEGNSFVGASSGPNIQGSYNTGIGYISGQGVTGGNSLTFVGSYATALFDTDLQYSTAIGARARVDQSYSIVLGGVAGINGAPSSTNVGIGTTAPAHRLHVVGNARVEGNVQVTGTITGGLAGSGGAVTDLNASNITTGTLGIARLGNGVILNQTTQQTSSGFNISGNGIVGANLGIGAGSPNSRLHIRANGQDGLKIQHTGTGSFPLIKWTDTADNSRASIAVDTSGTGSMNFWVNGNDRMIIQNNGVIRSTGGVFIQSPNTLVITSPNGACWGITVNNSGALTTFPVNPCP